MAKTATRLLRGLGFTPDRFIELFASEVAGAAAETVIERPDLLGSRTKFFLDWPHSVLNRMREIVSERLETARELDIDHGWRTFDTGDGRGDPNHDPYWYLVAVEHENATGFDSIAVHTRQYVQYDIPLKAVLGYAAPSDVDRTLADIVSLVRSEADDLGRNSYVIGVCSSAQQKWLDPSEGRLAAVD